jgi:hypothetical protein
LVEDRYLPTTLGGIHAQVAGEGAAMVFWSSLLMNGSMWHEYLEHDYRTGRSAALDRHRLASGT